MRQIARMISLIAISTQLTGCGSRAPVVAVSAMSSTLPSRQANALQGSPTTTAGAQQSGRSILNHPFVTWVKKQHPEAAVAIINDYLGLESTPGAETEVETERAELRRQVLQTVQGEFTRSLDKKVPDDLRARSEQDRIRIAGRVRYQIHDIQLTFDMTVRLDGDGKIWVALDEQSVKATAMNPLVGLFGGDLDAKAIRAIIEAFDKQGPTQVGKVAGLHYVPGAVFYVDCGEAFVNTTSLPSESADS